MSETLGEGAGARVREAIGPCSVDVRGWGWRHGGRLAWALDGVDLRIEPGERVLVLGPSGSGKSTLMSGLAGLLGGEDEGESQGSLLVDGAAPEERRGRIGLVMQDPEAQVVLARVGDDVAFGLENLAVAREAIWPRVDASLDSVGLEVARSRSTSRLSGGQKQRLALASVLAMRPGLLLLDEPTANLDPVGVAGVRDAVERVLEASGATLVVIEHRVDVWADLVDRVIVVLDGRIAADGPIDAVLASEGARLRERGIWLPGDDVAAELDDSGAEAARSATGSPASPSGTTAPPSSILSIRDLEIGYAPGRPVRTGIDLDVPRGASTCLIGANGTGKTTLALTLAGLLPQLAGRIEAAPAAGLPGESADPHDWSSKDLLGCVSMVFQEPEYQFVARTVREELEIGPRISGVEGAELAALVDSHLEALGLTALAEASPMSLSGGEKRRLSVATALISAPELLILDEPTFGQDRRTWLALVELLRAARARGTTLVSITHDPAYVAAMGDNVVDLGRLGSAAADESSDSGDPRSAGELADSPVSPVGADAIAAPEEARDTDSSPSAAPSTLGASPANSASPASEGSSSAARPIRSLLDRVNPVTHVLALILMTTPLVASVDAMTPSIALLLELGFVAASRIRVRDLLVRMSPLFIVAPLAALSMLLYADPGGAIFWSFGPIVVSERSCVLAAAILLRVLAIGMPAIVLLSRIDPTDMADGLAQVLRLPARPVLATLAAARMVGLMTADWKALEEARRIRGIGDAHKVVSAARGSFALLVFALRRSAKLSLTMEARGFGAPWPRTWARESRVGWPDFLMLAAALAVPVIALGSAIATGRFELVG